MTKIWHDEAWEDYEHWEEQDHKTLRKIKSLLHDIERNGYNCTGRPEQLSGNLAGWWSVKIDKQNRIVFKLVDNALEILQCGSHYRNK